MPRKFFQRDWVWLQMPWWTAEKVQSLLLLDQRKGMFRLRSCFPNSGCKSGWCYSYLPRKYYFERLPDTLDVTQASEDSKAMLLWDFCPSALTMAVDCWRFILAEKWQKSSVLAFAG